MAQGSNTPQGGISILVGMVMSIMLDEVF